jgi:hypothetical protein
MQSNKQSNHKLQELKTELDAWRTQQTGRKQIPQHFWASAYELLNHHSIGAVSRELRLDYKKLKKHLLSSNNIAHNSSTPPTFLELAASELAKSDQPTLHCDLHSDSLILPQAREACRIIFERSDGNRLTLHLPTDWLKIEAICNNFLRG